MVGGRFFYNLHDVFISGKYVDFESNLEWKSSKKFFRTMSTNLFRLSACFRTYLSQPFSKLISIDKSHNLVQFIVPIIACYYYHLVKNTLQLNSYSFFLFIEALLSSVCCFRNRSRYHNKSRLQLEEYVYS